MAKYVFDFSEGNRDLKDLLGGKGANLAEMTNLGLPVPPGFTITTETCRTYMTTGTLPPELRVQVTMALRGLEDALGRMLGDPQDPLLVSVRSGAKFSMPGMMETVLNVGLNDASVHGLARFAGDERFAWDSYRRLIQMFGKTVLNIDGELFSDALEAAKQAHGAVADTDLPAEALHALVDEFKDIVRRESGREFPQHPREQLDSPLRRSSTRGTPSARASTGAASASPTTWAPRSTSSRWSSATSVTTPARACASRAALRRAWPAPMAREISAAMAMPMPTWMPMVRNTSGKVNDWAARGSVPRRATNTLSTRLKPSSDNTPSVIGQVCCQIRRDRPVCSSSVIRAFPGHRRAPFPWRAHR